MKVKNKRKIKFRYKLIFSLIILSCFLFFYLTKIVNPIIFNYNKAQVEQDSTKILNSTIQSSLSNYLYEDLVSVEKNNSGDITLISCNSANVNSLSNEISLKCQNSLKLLGEKGINIPTERLVAVEKLFEDTGICYHFVENILLDMWVKYAGNIAQNLPQAIIGVGFGAYEDSPHMYQIAKELWREVSLVANAKGIPLQEDFVLFEGVRSSARFSTLQDLDAGRHTEIEMFAGEMIRMGKEYGIPVPYCEYTYHLIKALEEKNDGKFEY